MRLENIKGKRTVIYSRVSTLEQKETGYSLENQDLRLREFCKQHDLILCGSYKESYSARSVKRPEFLEMQDFIFNRKNNVELVLFYDWDRLTRKLGDGEAFMLFAARKNIAVNCINSWRDENVPVEKFTRQLNMALAEMDNAQKALRTAQGIIQSRKEGRWCSNVPLGYKRSFDLIGKPIMLIDKENGESIKLIFQDFSTGLFKQSEIIKKYSSENLKLTKSNIGRILRNPLYYGVVYYTENNQYHIVNGLHDGIISESTFNQVQELLLDKNKALIKPKSSLNDSFFLKGHIICKCCSITLTASFSRGKSGLKYPYYHGQGKSDCKERLKANIINDQFLSLLADMTPSNEVLELYAVILKDTFEKKKTSYLSEEKSLFDQISIFEKNKKVALDKLINGTLSDSDYRNFDLEINRKLIQLKNRLTVLKEENKDIEIFIDFAIQLMKNLSKFFEAGDVEVKDKILSSILKEKLIYDNGNYRTPVLNDALALILNNSNDFDEEIKKTGNSFNKVSRLVPKAGIANLNLY